MNTKKNNTLKTTVKSKSLIEKIKYELFVFVVLLAEMLLYMPHKSDGLRDCAYAYYVTNYSNMGFTGRMMLGSIIDLFTDFYSKKITLAIAFCVMASVIALMSFFIGGAIKKSGDGAPFLLFIFCLFILLPTSTEQFLGTNLGTIEVYHVLLTIVSLLLVRSKYLRWIVPLLFVVSNAMHCNYVFTYMSSVAIALFYNCSEPAQSDSSHEKLKISKNGIALCAVAFVFLVSSFVVFGMLEIKNPLIYDNTEQMRQALSEKTDLEITDHMLTDHFRADSDTKENADKDETFYDETFGIWSKVVLPHFTNNISSMLKDNILPLLLFLSVCMAVWITAYKAQRDKFKKLVLFFCIISPLITLPVFIYNDWEKYIGGMCITQLLLLCYFTKNETSVKTALARLRDKATENPAVMLSVFAATVMLRVI